MPSIHKTVYYSYTTGKLPKGCELCVQGKKLVLFITGDCFRKCFYCPLSEIRRTDKVFANEWDTGFTNKLEKKHLDIIIKEAKLCGAEGAGITGGDPLIQWQRAVKAIKALKKEFGKTFHIHLYTGFEHVELKRLKALCNAGLDEIRFHPVLWNDTLWNRIDIARKFPWTIGVEIPSIPSYEKQTKKLLHFLDHKVDFVNMNELELSDTNASMLRKLKYEAKDKTSYAVKGSKALALRLMRDPHSYPIHFCTSKLKDKVQLTQRIRRRAKRIALPFDTITKEGLLIRGVAYLPDLEPGFSYRKRLQSLTPVEKNNVLKRLREKQAKLPLQSIIDHEKLRLLCDPQELFKKRKDVKRLRLLPAIVEEYPTRDGMEVDIRML